MTKREKEKANAITSLKAILKPGSILDVQVVAVSRSGMYAHVTAKHLTKSGDWLHLEYNAAKAGAGDVRTHDGRNTVGVGGCGFSRTLAVADRVAWLIGYKLIQGRPTKHKYMRETEVTRTGYNGEPRIERRWELCKAKDKGAKPVLYMREG